jgi:hypothetical protein
MQTTNRLVVANSGWAESIPDWILEEIKTERLLYGIIGEDKVGDAEIVAYLYTASLTAPLTSETTNVYLSLTAELLKKQGKEVPDFMKKELNEDEKRELERLRSDIGRARGKVNHPIFEMLKELKNKR